MDEGRAGVQHRRDGVAGHRPGRALPAGRRAGRVRARGGLMMATSNRDRIGRMFELLAPPLDDFIARSVAAQMPDGSSWTALVAMKDKKRGVDGKAYDR